MQGIVTFAAGAIGGTGGGGGDGSTYVHFDGLTDAAIATRTYRRHTWPVITKWPAQVRQRFSTP